MKAEILPCRKPRVLAAARQNSRRRAKQAAMKTNIGNHSLRTSGITDYLKSDGSLDEARRMANYSDTRATQLYNLRDVIASLREYQKVGI